MRCWHCVCHREGAGQRVCRVPVLREGEAVLCDKRHFPTPEEVAAEVTGIEGEQTG